jgi:tetratricopeptide (TPR) repeat protein
MRTILFLACILHFSVSFSQDTIKVNKTVTPEEQAQLDYNSGLTAMKSGDNQAAVDMFTKSLVNKPDFDKALYNRGIAYTHLKNYPAATADINKVIVANPKNADAHFAKAMVFFNQSLKDSANRCLDNCLAVQKHPEAYYYKGLLAYEVADYDESIKAYTGAIEAKPDYAYAYNDRASAKRAKNDYTGAIADYEKALSLNPSLVFINNNLGSAYRLNKNYPKAIECYTKAMNDKPEYLLALNNRGAAKLEAGQLDEAKKDFEEVLKKDPKNSSAFNNLASVAIKQKDYKKAKDMASKSIELNVKNGPAYFNRGIARQMLREEEGSCADWKKASELGVTAAKSFMNTDCN